MRRSISITTALLISLFIYLFYRSERTLVNELAILFVPFDTYSTLKTLIGNALPLKEQVIFSLPGGLWIFCATVLAREFYLEVKNNRIQLSVVPVLFAIGLEFCQLLKLTNGTFDRWDIGFYLAFWLLGYSAFQPRDPAQKNMLSPFTLDGFVCVACFLSVYLAHVNQ